MHVHDSAPGVISPPAFSIRMARISFRLRTLRNFLLKALFFFFAASIALTLLFRWVPVPFSSLMVQRQIASFWESGKEKEFHLRYRWVGMPGISPHAALAVVAAEDQRFLDHEGFDFNAMSKAWEYNQHHRRQRGASTISQQVAKNLFLWPGRSFLRKGMEAYFTLLLEAFWPKQRIMEVYLNIAEFGRGIFGIEAASRAYFHKSAAKLNPAEAAILAAILPSPLRSNAIQPSGYIQDRAWHIQQQMHQLGGTGYVKPLVPPAKAKKTKKG
ncbi:MAG TPA: monofunctional biosynthetic peptidoglycan transglycosylase [Desulfurivibrionaceae bacterium]|nr:monofunctional biosynthetic peptidoglycan transglycosylase [Desulfurivibrionaceae bacterium]